MRADDRRRRQLHAREPSVGDFVQLMKPRVMSLVVFTALDGPGRGAGLAASRSGRRSRILCIARRRRRVGRAQHVVRRRHRRADGAHGGASDPARARDRATTRLPSASSCRSCSVHDCSALLVNWVAGGLLALDHRLLRRHLHDVAQAADAAEHRHRRRRRRLPAGDRLGRGRRARCRIESLAPVPHHLPVDAAALLGAVALLAAGDYAARRRADAAGGRRAATRRAGRSCSTRCCCVPVAVAPVFIGLGGMIYAVVSIGRRARLPVPGGHGLARAAKAAKAEPCGARPLVRVLRSSTCSCLFAVSILLGEHRSRPCWSRA